jgi:hypothetical protein
MEYMTDYIKLGQVRWDYVTGLVLRSNSATLLMKANTHFSYFPTYYFQNWYTRMCWLTKRLSKHLQGL